MPSAAAASLQLSSSAVAAGALAGFDIRPSLPAGFIPVAVATGDFNQDSKQDWVVASAGSNELWLFLGRGDGTAELPQIIPLPGQSPVSLVAADMNGDGKLDLIVGEADSRALCILLGLGNGRFGQGIETPVAGIPASILVRDFNGDGIPDVFASVRGAALTRGILLAGDGVGRMSPPISIVPEDLNFPDFTVDAGDLEGDGDIDLVFVRQFATGGEVSVLINEGGGNFKVGYSFQVFISDFTPLAARLADVDEDGCLDLAWSQILGSLNMFHGRCDGGFDPYPSNPVLATGDVNFAFEMKDINNDGHVDIISAGAPLIVGVGYGTVAGNLVSVMLGDGKGGFSRPITYRGEPGMYGMALVDLNNDGFLDVVTSNQDSDSVSVYMNDGSGGFGGAQGGYIGHFLAGNTVGGTLNSPRTQFRIADVDGDGDRDLVFLEYAKLGPEPSNIVTLLNDGTGKFPTLVRSIGTEGTLDINDFVLADFRNTGRPDFLALMQDRASFRYAGFTFAANAGGGAFANAKMTESKDANGRLGVGDFNRDGKLDFAAVSLAGGLGTSYRLTVFLGNGDGTFVPGQVVNFSAPGAVFHPARVDVGDFNRDGKLDVLVWTGDMSLIGAIGQQVHEFLGNGDGTFAAPRVVFTDFGPYAVVDTNRDGWPDVVGSNDPFENYPYDTHPKFSVYLGQPDGGFLKTLTYTPYAGLHSLALTDPHLTAGDLNGDGVPDILEYQRDGGSPNSPFLQIMLGNGDGTFTPTFNATRFSKVFAPQQLADVTGDGRADLIEMASFSSSFNVIPAKAGASISAAIAILPVIGTQGFLRITLAVPSSSATTVGLLASDPAISVPPSANLPPGTVTQDVPFQIGSAFDSTYAFSISAKLGSDTAVAYGSQARSNGQVGFQYVIVDPARFIVSGQTSFDYAFGFYSVAGYSSTISVHCEGLPAGATCLFDNSSLFLAAGGTIGTYVRVASTNSLLTGHYVFQVVATDGVITQRLPLILDVGDFSVALVPATRTIAASSTNPTAVYELRFSAANNYSGIVNVTCSGLPANFLCGVPSVAPVPTPTNASTPFSIQATSTPAGGTYSFTVTATTFDGLLSRSVTGQLLVSDVSVTPPVSTTATLSVGGSAQFTFGLTSQGVSDQFSFNCLNPPVGISCSFNPNPLSLAANASGSTVLTVAVNSRPSVAPPIDSRRWPIGSPPIWLLSPIVIAIAILQLLRCTPRAGKRLALGSAAAMLVLVFLATFSVSCGGGGSGGGGTPPVITPPPTQPPKIVVLAVQATSPSTTKSLGTLTITVP
ncbi:MAG: VCBS repeat-containing protein [Acidobacteria bacterium]|nr:VCBS repeat-containing protein [Acidobacteriota bacterium]